MEAIFIKIMTYGWLAAAGLGGYVWRQHKAELKEYKTKLDAVQKEHTKFITETEAKALMKEIVSPIIQDQKEVKNDLKQILAALVEIQKELAVAAAIREIEKENNKEHR